MKANRFQKGSGIYNCENCKRATRATGGNDNEHLRLCVECYNIAGLENQLADSHEIDAEPIRNAIRNLEQKCRAKGGKI
jgi:hypothetical protein